jgi:dTDP-4-dehydrorhamnose 3,5-epimerase
MKLELTPIEGLLTFQRTASEDERGLFTRLFAKDELSAAGRPTEAVHINSSSSVAARTLRGLHFQFPPYAETKIVSCVSGSVWDVGVDLRPESPTRFQWFGTTLSPENRMSLIIPEGFGHGFLTLEPNSTLVYVVSAPYSLPHESGARYDDPAFSIDWPFEPLVISDKDQSWTPVSSRLGEIDFGFL